MTEQVTKIDLFPFYKCFFSDDGSWEQLSDVAKLQHAFMLNRLISIKHPEYMQCLNTKHSVVIMNALHEEFKTKGRQPSWAYTKTSGSNHQIEDPLKHFPKHIIDAFCKFHEVERKSLDFLLTYAKQEVLEELNEQLKIYNQTAKVSKSKK